MKVKSLKKHTYVTHLLLDGSQTRDKINSRRVRDIEPREDSFGFIVFEQIEVEVEDGKNVVECTSNTTYESGIFFTKGELMTKLEVSQRFPENEEIILLMNRAEETIGKSVKVVYLNDKFYIFRDKDKMYERR